MTREKGYYLKSSRGIPVTEVKNDGCYYESVLRKVSNEECPIKKAGRRHHLYEDKARMGNLASEMDLYMRRPYNRISRRAMEMYPNSEQARKQ